MKMKSPQHFCLLWAPNSRAKASLRDFVQGSNSALAQRISKWSLGSFQLVSHILKSLLFVHLSIYMAISRLAYDTMGYIYINLFIHLSIRSRWFGWFDLDRKSLIANPTRGCLLAFVWFHFTIPSRVVLISDPFELEAAQRHREQQLQHQQ